MSSGFIRITRLSPWLTYSGVVCLLIGLGWDAVLHALDPGLAAREGIFTLANPGHVLLMGGMGLVVLGVLLHLAQAAREADPRGPRGRLVYGLLASALVVLATGSLGLGLASGNATELGHHHHAELAHASTEPSSDAHHHAHDAVPHAARNPSPLAGLINGGITHDHGELVNVTAEELEAAYRLMVETRTGTERFQDFEVARAEGYRQITVGLQGIAHYHNDAYLTDGRVLDPERPEDLIYLRLPNGEQQLVGVMYLMPPGQPGPRVGGPLTSWHAYDNLCHRRSDGMVVAVKINGSCPLNTVNPGASPEMLHVWLVDNPNGVFSDDMQPAALRTIATAAQSDAPSPAAGPIRAFLERLRDRQPS